jgi:protein-S-isoprenylcysteine O-methyltransferase Ste14
VAGSGTAVVLDAMATFRSLERISGTEIDTLITEGIYRYSRNPQILGSGLALVGVAVAGRSPVALSAVVVFMVLSHVYLLWLEEPQLEETFGEAYREYRTRTPRYLGLPAEGEPT